MARLPRYQESGLISADIPRMDFANLREESRQAQTIGDALTKISEFAFGAVQKKREQENKLMGIQLRTDFEMEAAKELATIDAMIESGGVKNITEVQEYITALAQKQTKVLGRYSAEQAAGLANSIGSQGRALMAKASKRITDVIQANNDIGVADTINAEARLLETLFETAGSEEEIARGLFEADARINGIAIGSSNPTKAIEEWRKARVGARDNSFARYFGSTEFATTENERLLKLDKGDAGRYTTQWNRLSADEKKKVKDRIYDSQVQKIEAVRRERDLKRIENETAFVDRYREYVTEKNPNKRAEIARDLLKLADTTAEIDKVLKAPTEGGSLLLFSNLREQIRNGEIQSIVALQRYVRPGGIDQTQLNSLQTEFYDLQTKEYSAASKKLKDNAGVGDLRQGFFDPKEARFVKNEVLQKRFKDRVNEIREQNKTLPPDKQTPLNFDQIATEVIENYDKVDKANATRAAAASALKNFEALAKSRNKQVTLDENTNIDDLRKTKIFTAPELDAIQKQLTILRQQQQQ